MSRQTDAIAVSDGACNPSGICHAILRACDEIRSTGGGALQIVQDPAVKLMVYQLSFLTAADELESLDVFSRMRKACGE